MLRLPRLARASLPSAQATRAALLAVVTVGVGAGCRNCDNLGAVKAAGAIEPAVFEFGPLTAGSQCQALLQVTNHGQEDLSVSGSSLENTNGDFTLKKAPALVRIGAAEDLLVDYTANGNNGDLQSTGIKLQTDDADDNGILRATITAIVTTEPAASVKTRCGAADAEVSPCASLDFGATQVNGSGITLGVKVVNDGNADMHISFAAINEGNPDFTLDSVLLGSSVVTDFPQNAITLPPGRSTDCGQPTGTDANVATFNVHYAPSALGADVDTLVITTDAVDSPEVDVPLSGAGSDIGIVMTPATVNFGALSEGDSDTVDVRVANVGTSQASVNDACIDVENDGTCDAPCTGQASDSALSGTLTCKVTTTDGSLESHGFVLAATDAVDGGADERNIAVTWAPAAGADRIPATAVLALHSNVLGNRIFTAPIIGGSIGIIEASTPDGDCTGGPDADACVHATGDAADFSTWAGTVTLRLTNTGQATVNLGTIEKDGNAGIIDDYALGAPSQTAIAPGDHADIVLTYDESTGGDAGASDEIMNVLVHHDGAGALTTIVVDVIPPT